MATYFYVELAEGYVPSTKSRASLPSQLSISPSDCLSQDLPPSQLWSLTTDNTAFVMRVPNESIIRLFSLLVTIAMIERGNEITHWLGSQSKSVTGEETKQKTPLH